MGGKRASGPLGWTPWLLAVLATGCGGGQGGSGDGGASGGAAGSIVGGRGGGGGTPVAPTRNVDLLLLIDNSVGMTVMQEKLRASASNLIEPLWNLPGGPPNLHVAVVSSDMGAGTGLTNCTGNGDAGAFHFAAVTPCVDTTLADGATFIVHEPGRTNYTASSLTDVISCIAPIGAVGCGYEQHLAAIVRALGADGAPPPPENVGFLRADADLVILVLTDEDDCSTFDGAGSALFDLGSRRLADPLGPVGGYRCAEFGHLCGTPPMPPPREAPTGSTMDSVTLGECVSNENSPYLKPVDWYAREVKALKASPDTQILVAAISGPKTPYRVTWYSGTLPDTGPWPGTTEACVSGSSSTLSAFPAVRLRDWVSRFGDNGLAFDACTDDYGPILRTLAEKIAELMEK